MGIWLCCVYETSAPYGTRFGLAQGHPMPGGRGFVFQQLQKQQHKNKKGTSNTISTKVGEKYPCPRLYLFERQQRAQDPKV